MPQPIRKYKDLDLNLSCHPNTHDLMYVQNDEAVKRSVKNIILTSYNERHFDDFFGSDVNSSLFENISPMTIINIQNSIENALNTFEPRITLLNVELVPDFENNGYSATIWFNILNQINPVKVDLFLEKVR